MNSLSLKKNIVTVVVFCLSIILLDGCTGSSSSNDAETSSVSAFTFSGSTANISTSISLAAVLNTKYVYAVNTSPGHSSEVWRKMEPLNSDGSFSIELSKGGAWVIAFIDTSKTGADMIEAIFKASELDTVAPKESSANDGTDVGELTVDSDKKANIASYNYDTFIGDLGMNSEEAIQYGLTDDMCLRLINPDMDSDGIVDIEDPDMPNLGMNFMIEYLYGDANTMLDYLRNGDSLPTDAAMIYRAGTVALSLVKADTSIFSQLPGKWSIEWSDSGSYDGKNPAEWNGTNTADYIGAHDINDNTRWFYEIGFPETTDLPEGNYTYRFYTDVNDTIPFKTLQFPYVNALDDVNNTANVTIPFPVFNADADGYINSVDYTWMRHNGISFVPATREDIEMADGGLAAPQVGWSTPSGSIDYAIDPSKTDYALTGTIPSSEFDRYSWSGSTTLKRSELNFVKVFYTTKSGMNIWISINPLFNVGTRAPESYP